MHILGIQLLVQLCKELLPVNTLGLLVPVQKPGDDFLISSSLFVGHQTRFVLLFVKPIDLSLDLLNLFHQLFFCFVRHIVTSFKHHSLFVKILYKGDCKDKNEKFDSLDETLAHDHFEIVLTEAIMP